MFAALIGDIVGSRAVPDRALLQRTVRSTIGPLNEAFQADLASRFVITTGDEFQALFRAPGPAVRAAVTATERLLPHRVRFGVGWGDLDTDLRPEAVGMDGPCFHRARDAIDEAKRDGAWTRVRGLGDAVEARVVNAHLDLIAALRDRWTAKQANYVIGMRSHDTQRALAESEGVSPSVVSESLKAAHHAELREAESALEPFLDRLSEPRAGGP